MHLIISSDWTAYRKSRPPTVVARSVVATFKENESEDTEGF